MLSVPSCTKRSIDLEWHIVKVTPGASEGADGQAQQATVEANSSKTKSLYAVVLSLGSGWTGIFPLRIDTPGAHTLSWQQVTTPFCLQSRHV